MFVKSLTLLFSGYCYTWETECSNGKCIDDDIACNGFNPCGDESDCRARTIAIIIGASVGGVVFVILLISIGVCIYCAKRRNVASAGYVVSTCVERHIGLFKEMKTVNLITIRAKYFALRIFDLTTPHKGLFRIDTITLQNY